MSRNSTRATEPILEEIENKMGQVVPLFRQYRGRPDEFMGLDIMSIEAFHGFTPPLERNLRRNCRKYLNFDPWKKLPNDDVVLVSYSGNGRKEKKELILRLCSIATKRDLKGDHRDVVQLMGRPKLYKIIKEIRTGIAKQNVERYLVELCALGAAFDSFSYPIERGDYLDGNAESYDEDIEKAARDKERFFEFLEQWLAVFDSALRQRQGKAEYHESNMADRINIKITILEFYKLLIVLEKSGVIEKINYKIVADIVRRGPKTYTPGACRQTRSKAGKVFLGNKEIEGRDIFIDKKLTVRVGVKKKV